MEKAIGTFTRRLALAVVLSLVAVSLVWAQVSDGEEAPGTEPMLVNETTDLWFVELMSAPTADGTSLSTVREEKNAFRANARLAGLQYTERRSFDVLWNGLSVKIKPSDLGALARIPGVKALYPVAQMTPSPVKAESGADLATALAQTGADIAHNSLGLTGAGVRAGIIDTGTGYHHPDLGGCFGPGCRVEFGHDFVGNGFDAAGSGAALIPVPDADPDDCNDPTNIANPRFAGGHGTHVSGIVGANGSVIGVAPAVTFGAYRVFGCVGSTSADIMISAMEMALADGMNVVNMSIGSAFQWPQYPTAQASNRLVNKGVVVVASIGNSGANGVYSASAPGLGEKVIGVASFDNSHIFQRYFTITPDDLPIGYNQAAGAPAAPTTGSFPMARTGTQTSTADACAALPAGSLTGKVALIRRGTCTFYAKSRNAQLAGAAAVVIYNNVAGIQGITVAGTPAVTIPVVSISQAQGNLIDTRLAGGPVTMTWTSSSASFPNITGGLISSFSSYGLSPDLTLKPDIGAPGGLIRSTYPVELGGPYAVLSGTSMSSPHTAGAAALLLEARPNTPSNAVRTILQNSADPKPWSGNPGLGFLDQVHRQGAGMLDIDDAILSTTKIEPGKLSLGESEAGPVTRTLTLANKSANPVTYDLSHVAALATGGSTNAPGAFASFATVGFSSPSVIVPANGTASVDVTITAPATAGRQYGGYIVFTPAGGGQGYRVPYAGFSGNYQSIIVLVPTANGFPRLARLTSSGSFTILPAGGTFNMTDDLNIPYILVHLEHQSRMLRMEVKDAVSGKSFHRALQFDYLGRNSTATGFFALPWDGITTNGSKLNLLPDGQYVIELTVLKALGDASNPAHVETWTSPVITIDRP